MKAIGLILAATLLASVSGCCTIISGTTQEIPVSSTPSGAKVQLDGKDVGTTPVTLTVPRSVTQAHTLLLMSDGYEPKTETLTPKLNGWYWLNLPTTLFVGMFVDLIAGTTGRYAPGEVTITLTEKK